jgi:dihydroxy-acid dehydratase
VHADLSSREKDWQPREMAYKTGVFAKYAKLVSSASQGAVTNSFSTPQPALSVKS